MKGKLQEKDAKVNGEEYRKVKGKRAPAKMIRKPCSCKNKCFETVTLPDREKLFKEFYSLSSYEDQLVYLSNLLTITEPKKMSINTGKTRSRLVSYVVHLEGEPTLVCKKAFCSIYAIPEQSVKNFINKIELGDLADNRGKFSRHNAITKNHNAEKFLIEKLASGDKTYERRNGKPNFQLLARDFQAAGKGAADGRYFRGAFVETFGDKLWSEAMHVAESLNKKNRSGIDELKSQLQDNIPSENDLAEDEYIVKKKKKTKKNIDFEDNNCPYESHDILSCDGQSVVDDHRIEGKQKRKNKRKKHETEDTNLFESNSEVLTELQTQDNIQSEEDFTEDANTVKKKKKTKKNIELEDNNCPGESRDILSCDGPSLVDDHSIEGKQKRKKKRKKHETEDTSLFESNSEALTELHTQDNIQSEEDFAEDAYAVRKKRKVKKKIELETNNHSGGSYDILSCDSHDRSIEGKKKLKKKRKKSEPEETNLFESNSEVLTELQTQDNNQSEADFAEDVFTVRKKKKVKKKIEFEANNHSGVI